MNIKYTVKNIVKNSSVSFQKLYKIDTDNKIILNISEHDNSIKLTSDGDFDIDNYFNLPVFLKKCFSKNQNPLPILRKLFQEGKFEYINGAVFFADICIIGNE